MRSLFGWLVVPLLFDGVDRTIDPLKLARFPLRTGTLMAAMFVVGLTWLPGAATIVVSVGTAIAWRTHPLSAVAAVVAGLIGAATCVAGSRLATSAVGALLRGRGAARVGVAAFVVLLLAGPLAFAVVGGFTGSRDELFSSFAVVLGVLEWTPVGAVWSVPGRLAMGDLAGAAARRSHRARHARGFAGAVAAGSRRQPASARRAGRRVRSRAVASDCSGGCRPHPPGRFSPDRSSTGSATDGRRGS